MYTLIGLRAVETYLTWAGVDVSEYAIGESAEDKLCVVRQGEHGPWKVFDFKNGREMNLYEFPDDELACTHAFGVLVSRHIADGTLSKKSD